MPWVPFLPPPPGWPVLDAARLEYVRSQATLALADRDLVIARLLSYYDVDGPHAGATFLELHPNDPTSIAPSDLLAALTLTGVRDVRLEVPGMPPAAVRRLTGSGPVAGQIAALLRSPELDPSIDLLTASADTFTTMASLHRAVTAAIADLAQPASSPTGSPVDSPATPPADWESWLASALCARKRPGLFPVPDPVVRAWLSPDVESAGAPGSRAGGSTGEGAEEGTAEGTAPGWGAGSSWVDWQLFRALLSDRAIVASVDSAVNGVLREARSARSARLAQFLRDAGDRAPGPPVGTDRMAVVVADPLQTLHHLYVVLRMHALAHAGPRTS